MKFRKYFLYLTVLSLLLIRRRKLAFFTSTWRGRLLALYGAYYFLQWIKPRQTLAGKLILVTGGARGIGKAIALELAKRGARVVIWDLHADALREALNEVQVLGQCWGHVVDISDRNQVYETARQMQTTLGNLWGLVNNAGFIGSGKQLLQLSDGDVERTINVNFLSHVWTLKAFLPGMLERNDGHVVAVASFGGFVGASGMTVYGASKAAVISLMESVRLEIRKARCFNVGTSVICPGHVKTDLFAGFKTSQTFMPSLDPNYVAKKAVEAMQRKWPLLIMPSGGYVSLFFRSLLPYSVNEWLGEVGGLSNCMDNFVGRQGV